MGFFLRPDDGVMNLGLGFLGSWMAPVKGQDVQGGQDFTLVPPEHPEATFEAVSEVV